ncbi:hypothetical protein HQ584_07995 [Patescibacteria group bacterium]|nr:hypothetical protein [Patescibacteria group bacterium]
MGFLLIIILWIVGVCLYKDYVRKKIEDEINNIVVNSPGMLISNRKDALDHMWDILMPIHLSLKCEALVVIYLDSMNKVIDTDVRFGDRSSVSYPTDEIISNVKDRNAKKIVLGHNHPNNYTKPSDQDVYHCSCLYVNALSENIDLMDDLVVCGIQLKSITNTRRFKQMVKAY